MTLSDTRSVQKLQAAIDCVKCVQIRSFFWSVFCCTRTRKNFVFGQFSSTDSFGNFVNVQWREFHCCDSNLWGVFITSYVWNNFKLNMLQGNRYLCVSPVDTLWGKCNSSFFINCNNIDRNILSFLVQDWCDNWWR